MVENGNNGYYEFEAALSILKDKLGISKLYLGEDSEIAPIFAKWIASKLTLSGFSDLLDLLRVVEEEYKKGQEEILEGNCEALYRDVMGIPEPEVDNDSGDEEMSALDDSEGPEIDTPIEDEDIPEIPSEEEEIGPEALDYDHCIFNHLWTEFMASLWTQLKILYWEYLYPVEPKNCGCACGYGENYADWENYTSGVVPEDDEYKTDFGYANGTPSYGNGCCCGYRKA